MNRLLALLALLATITSGATAAAVPNQRRPLTQTPRNCDGSGTTLAENFGFVNLVRTGSDKLVATAVLQGGTRNANFNVRLIQIPNDGTCGECTSGGATLTTDSLGDGSINVQQAVSPGATAAWVDLNDKTSCPNFFNSEPVKIIM